MLYGVKLAYDYGTNKILMAHLIIYYIDKIRGH